MEIPPWTKPGIWGAVIGAVAISIVGFSWLGWVRGSTAEQMGKQRADAAMVSALIPLCIDRFKQQADVSDKLKQMKAAQSWDQSSFIEKGGWANNPGEANPNSGLARACAEALGKLTL